jgi:hypothetical protein
VNLETRQEQVFGISYLCVIEAKKVKFDLRIAQCLIAMAVCISQNPEPITVHGIVSSRQVWQFLRCEPNKAVW